MGARRGVIFSIDAFVAFSLILIAIYGLFVLIGTPKSYFTSLEQTADLAHDTLLSLTRLQDSGQSYLELIAEGYSSDPSSPIHHDVNSAVERAIPKQFGYMFEIYDSSVGGWVKINATYSSDRTKTAYNESKLAASAQAPIAFYKFKPVIGDSPWCYQTCRGYQSDGTYAGIGPNGQPQFCPNVPCGAPTPFFEPGELAIGWVRFTVFI